MIHRKARLAGSVVRDPEHIGSIPDKVRFGLAHHGVEVLCLSADDQTARQTVGLWIEIGKGGLKSEDDQS
jgi:hypothetical protein